MLNPGQYVDVASNISGGAAPIDETQKQKIDGVVALIIADGNRKCTQRSGLHTSSGTNLIK